MILTSRTLTPARIADIVAQVSREAYGGNVVADVVQVGPTRTRLKINARRGRPEDPRDDAPAIGARRSASGRRGPWACWHVFRDVLAVIFREDPAAIVRTRVAIYRGADDFLQTFPETGERNIGSMVEWLSMADACACEADGGRDDVSVSTAPDYVDTLEGIRRDVRAAAILTSPYL